MPMTNVNNVITINRLRPIKHLVTIQPWSDILLVRLRQRRVELVGRTVVAASEKRYYRDE